MALKLYLKKLSAFIVIGIVIFITLSVLAESQNSRVEFRVKQLIEKADSISVLAVGNSHTGAFDFEALAMNGYRIAQGGNDLFETEYQIRALLPLLPNLKLVIINISYFSFFMDNSAVPASYAYFNNDDFKDFTQNFPYAEKLLPIERYPEFVIIDTDEIGSVQKNKLGAALDVLMQNTSDRLQLRQRYYNSIPSTKWVKDDLINFIESKVSAILREDHWKSVFSNLFSLDNKSEEKNPEEIYGIDKYGQFKNDLIITHPEKDSLEKMVKDIQVPLYHYNIQVMKKFNPEIVNETYETLGSIIVTLRSKGIRIVFVTTPVYEAFTEYFDRSVIKVMQEKTKQLKNEYQITYLDYSNDSSFVKNYKYFYNSDHLNKSGSKEFSKQLLVELSMKYSMHDLLSQGLN